MPRLIDHAVKQAEGVPLRLPDVAGQEVTILSVEFSSGAFGNYATMRVENADGEEFDLMTGAKLVMDALEHASESLNESGECDGFPCSVTFTEKGRTWIMA